MKKVKFLSFIIVLITLLQSCNNDDSTPVVPVDVYLAGQHIQNGIWVPAFWKNGQSFNLSDREGNATAMLVTGTDVYFGGSIENNAALWKNGDLIKLTEGSSMSFVRSIQASESGIRVLYFSVGAGGDQQFSLYNGTSSIVLEGVANVGYQPMAVVGTDVYIIMNEYSYDLGNHYPTVWKNGNKSIINTPGAEAHCIAVSGTDVYVGGASKNDNNKYVATLWKNGVPVSLSAAGSAIYNIKVEDTNVYALGYETNTAGTDVAVYWKNEQKFTVSDGTKNTYGYQWEIKNSDIYVVGEFHDGSWYTGVWKNGSRITPFLGNEADKYVSGIAIH